MFVISIDPVAFTVGSVEVRWYGIMVSIAIVAVILWMIRQIDSRKPNLPTMPNIMIAPVGIIAGMIGAKLVHVLEQLNYYSQHPLQVFSGGGFAIYGGVLGATLGIWIYLKVTHQEKGIKHFGFFVDLVAPGIILAQAIGRVGCLLNGCCHGTIAPDWFHFTVIYTNPASDCSIPGVPIYPTQLYEIIFAVIVFFILLRIRKHFEPMEGALFLIYLILYSGWRLGVGYLRSDMQIIPGLSQSQIISIAVLGVCIFLLARMRHRFKSDAVSDVEITEGGSEEEPSPPTAPSSE